ncbi:hypothetical protein L1987_49857 [Smallanthus sonchifolius]|uniref:Uncharacterized protein n=1 Tax=Smallanthus sonchifolius TaxID=185202 RepID=A0ACB9FWW9_9ASTR|nr:hypothetical protein L1987_49857 [Smallanthus sonchifolius]
MNEFKIEHPQDDVKTKFSRWFLEKVYSMKKQNSPEFHSELYALSIGADINASTYASCIVNGVRFMVEPDEVSENDTDEANQVEPDEVSENESEYYTEGSDSDTEVSEGELSEG